MGLSTKTGPTTFAPNGVKGYTLRKRCSDVPQSEDSNQAAGGQPFWNSDARRGTLKDQSSNRWRLTCPLTVWESAPQTAKLNHTPREDPSFRLQDLKLFD